tara:strand:+ start:17392 stop:17802 length:411 start_codon:yes stop_codon:yes gene_type:complete
MELSNNLNYIPSFLKTIIFDNESNQIKFLLIFILIAGILSYLHGMIKENVINGTSIIIIFITFILTYFYIKKLYSKKYKLMRNKINSLSKPTTLDNLCINDNLINENNKKLCIKYVNAKKNFYDISDYLLKNFKYN